MFPDRTMEFQNGSSKAYYITHLLRLLQNYPTRTRSEILPSEPYFQHFTKLVLKQNLFQGIDGMQCGLKSNLATGDESDSFTSYVDVETQSSVGTADNLFLSVLRTQASFSCPWNLL
ncbi:hypothetical protein V6N13_085190 [Hibiscus sabdariffa]|uniref:Uncharacterized protein n=1 Tax=Hibiscus sabdariffa TaxID=183260 RepID=A0ABR2D164_9ROSI